MSVLDLDLNNNRKKGQVFLITVFSLTIFIFFNLLILAPIREKVMKLKEMDYIFQAYANAEKSMETFLIYLFKEDPQGNKIFGDLFTSTTISTINKTQNCGEINSNTEGDCKIIEYQPTTTTKWRENENNNIKVIRFDFESSSSAAAINYYIGGFEKFNRFLISRE